MARNTAHGQKVPIYKTWWFWVIIILFIYGFVSNMTGSDDEEEDETSESEESSAAESICEYEFAAFDPDTDISEEDAPVFVISG